MNLMSRRVRLLTIVTGCAVGFAVGLAIAGAPLPTAISVGGAMSLPVLAVSSALMVTGRDSARVRRNLMRGGTGLAVFWLIWAVIGTVNWIVGDGQVDVDLVMAFVGGAFALLIRVQLARENAAAHHR